MAAEELLDHKVENLEQILRLTFHALRKSGVDLNIERESTRQARGQRRLLCTVSGCISSFSRQYELTRHLKTVHGEKKRCSYWGCSYGTARVDKMREHVHKKHYSQAESSYDSQIPEPKFISHRKIAQGSEQMLWKSPLATSTQSVVTEHAVETFKNPNGISSLVGFSLSPTYRMGIGERCAGLEMDETFHE